jgi:general stress protein YciG
MPRGQFNTPVDSATGKTRRGFASMDPEKRRAIAAKGGASAPASKRSFYKDRQLAAEAGRKGGLSTRGDS